MRVWTLYGYVEEEWEPVCLKCETKLHSNGWCPDCGITWECEEISNTDRWVAVRRVEEDDD